MTSQTRPSIFLSKPKGKRMTMKTAVYTSMLAAVGAAVAFGDEVTDWNRIMLDAFSGPRPYRRP